MTAYPFTLLILLLIVVLQVWMMGRVARQRGRARVGGADERPHLVPARPQRPGQVPAGESRGAGD